MPAHDPIDSTEVTETGHPAATRPRHNPFDLRPGDAIGRYVILHELGRGSEGIVFAARDPELRRTVALKCLVADPRSGWPRARMIREARALARIDHANVVKIFDVLDLPTTLAFAMERIDGTDLRRWLAAAPRAPGDILEVMRKAGAGLAAAHDAGLVHRDFKPANVLVAQDGRVVVTDFGLVREDPLRLQAHAVSDPIFATKPRVALGTPRYMAPEQMLGAEVDARVDQFAFCVSLFEACFGQPPFGNAAGSGEMLAARMKPATPPSDAPPWLAAVLRRGLAPDPRVRFASIPALLDALHPPRRRAVRTLVVLGLGAGVAVLAAQGTTPATTDASAQLGASLGFGLQRVPMLYTAQRGDLPERHRFAEELLSRHPEIETTATRAARVVLLDDAMRAGRYLEALPELEALAVEADRAGDDDNAADAAMMLVDLCALRLERLDEAERWLGFAAASVARMRHPHREVPARLRELEGFIAFGRGDDERARDAFEGAIEILPADATMRAAQLHANLGAANGLLGDLQESREQFELAIALQEQRGAAGDVDEVGLGHDEANLASTLLVLGQSEAALEHAERALERLEGALGPTHPEVAQELVNLAGVYIEVGQPDRAIAALEQAIEVHTRARGSDDRWVARAQALLAVAYEAVGNPTQAREAANHAMLRVQGRAEPDTEAWARFVLARTTWRGSPVLAHRHAELAATLFEASQFTAADRTRVHEWLAEHPLPVSP